MGRPNWQRRAELSESRRNDAKQRKQRNEEKKVNKSRVQNLLATLDAAWLTCSERFTDTRPWTVDIWVDVHPSDAPPLLDLSLEVTSKPSKRKGRQAPEDPESTGANFPKRNSGKAHPRSKESPRSQSVVETEDDFITSPRLCRSQFFSGKCKSGNSRKGKKVGCRHMHYPKQYRTLYGTIVASLDQGPVEETLHASSLALPLENLDETTSQVSGSDRDTMDMVYHVPIIWSFEDSPSAFIHSQLGEKSCGVASVQYIVVQGCLVFDRYQSFDATLSEDDLIFLASGHNIVSRQSFAGEDTSLATHLPASVLEEILYFLEDEAVAYMSSVCKAWNKEIGKHSANLWRTLLQRHGWSLQGIQDNLYREAFLSHYGAVRDMRSLGTATISLLTGKGNDKSASSCFRSFASTKESPHYPNACVGVEIWSPNRMLAAYSQDCTIRLYASAPGAKAASDTLCRQLICRSLDPYKHTRKIRCCLLALGLDDSQIVCLVRVFDERKRGETYTLNIMSRDDFLVDDESEHESMHTFDVAQMVLDYLLGSEEDSQPLQQLDLFLSSAGELDDIEVLVSKGLVSCGYGRFLTEVTISIPNDEVDDNGSIAMTVVTRQMLVFSASVGGILWMCDSNPQSRTMLPRHEDLTLAAVQTGKYGRGCDVFAASPSTLDIVGGSIDESGNYQAASLLKVSDLLEELSSNDSSWGLHPMPTRAVAVFQPVFVVADTMVQELQDERKRCKTVVSFHSIDSGNDAATSKYLHLRGNLAVHSLTRMREQYVLALCKCFSGNVGPTAEVDNAATSDSGSVSVFAVIVDVASRTEVGRVRMVKNLLTDLDEEQDTSEGLPLHIAVSGNTLAAGISWKGVVLAGQDVSYNSGDASRLLESSSPSPGKKKKRKNNKKGGKKDGFARGMSRGG